MLTDGRGGGKISPFPKICHTYLTMTKLGTVIPYLKQIQKIHESRNTSHESCWLQQLFTRIQQILQIKKKTCRDCIWYKIFSSFNFCWVFKDCFNKKSYNFMMSAKMATPGFTKIKVFWNKGYDVITSAHNVTNKIDSNYILDVVMWSMVM